MILKSPLKLVFMAGAILFMVSACATVPTEPLPPGELRLLRIDVPQKEDLRESVPFVATISFKADSQSHPEIVTVCFFWSGGGPHCSRVADVTYGSPGIIKVQLRPISTGVIALEAYVVYKKDGKTESTNVVGERIRVIRPSL